MEREGGRERESKYDERTNDTTLFKKGIEKKKLEFGIEKTLLFVFQERKTKYRKKMEKD